MGRRVRGFSSHCCGEESFFCHANRESSSKTFRSAIDSFMDLSDFSS
jgi:hypothetical protein